MGGKQRGVVTRELRNQVGKITNYSAATETDVDRKGQFQNTYNVQWLFENQYGEWEAIQCRPGQVSNMTYSLWENDFTLYPIGTSQTEVQQSLPTLHLHRRMAQREFSSRRDSPTMVRLLEQIVEANKRHQQKVR